VSNIKVCFITGTRAEYDLLKPPENTEVKPTIYIVGLTKTDKTTMLKEYPKKYIKLAIPINKKIKYPHKNKGVYEYTYDKN